MNDQLSTINNQQSAINHQPSTINHPQSTIRERPKIEPLSRLVVRDGMLLNAERWQQAHQYHRQRQNLHYQSLHQPGIVCGLGVKAIAAPHNIPAQYRQEKRWLRIEPGMAIDDWGNPIIVPETIDFRLAAYPQQSAQTVYLIISYVDPDGLELIQETDFVREMFRIEEKLSPPAAGEIELCRILLQSEVIELTNPKNALFPQANQLDLRDRPTATLKPQKIVKVAQIATANPVNPNWQYLFSSLDSLYPAMSYTSQIKRIDLSSDLKQLVDFDLLWLTRQELYSLQEAEINNLSKYLAAGCVVTIEVSSQETNIGELSAIKHKLESALTEAQSLGDFPEIPQQIAAELQACEAKLTEQVQEITTVITQCFAQGETADFLNLSNNNLEPKGDEEIEGEITNITNAIAALIPEINDISQANLGKIGRNHPLRNQPFLFSQFPVINDQLIEIFNWGGIVLIIGDLSTAWGINGNLNLSRETIRTAQEMGINLLHFAWQKHHLTKLIQ